MKKGFKLLCFATLSGGLATSFGSEPRSPWEALGTAVEVARHAARPVEDVPGEWRLQNHANGFEICLNSAGMSMKVTIPKYNERAPLVRWETTGVGYGNILSPVPTGEVVVDSAEKNRIEIRRGNLVEWYVNSRTGLEHGYTLAKRPQGSGGGEMLRVEMRLGGDLRAEDSNNGMQVTLINVSGREIIRYEKLKVWDAHGRDLPARMTVSNGKVTLEVDDSTAVYPLTIDPIFTQRSYLKASNTRAGDLFGSSVAVDGKTIVVGAAEEDGIDVDSGAAYVFTFDGADWTEQAYLKASNASAGNKFGASVAISGDTLVVGAPQENGGGTAAGAAYVFVRNGDTWSQHAYLKAANVDAHDRFGSSVSISGTTVLVGAPGEDSFSTSINTSASNNGANSAGAAYVFLRNGGSWTQQAYLKPSNTGADDRFGYSVSLSGDSAAVGALDEDGGSIGVNGAVNNDKANSGAAYVFFRVGTAWSQQAYIKASNPDIGDQFGTAVSINVDTLAVGAPHEDSWAVDVDGDDSLNGPPGTNGAESGAAYIFKRDGLVWSQEAYVKAQYPKEIDYFGSSLAVSGNALVVGALNESSDVTGINGNGANNYNALDSGAAYVYLRDDVTWTREAYLKATNADAFDYFGNSVAVSGGTIVVGAFREDSVSTGVGGNEEDDSEADSGAVYVFLGEGDEFGKREFWGAGPELASNETGDRPAELDGVNATSTAWSYGTRSSFLGTDLTVFTAGQHQNGIGHPDVDGWIPGAGVLVNKGTSPAVVSVGGETTIPVLPGQIILKPITGAFPVVRWTAPEAGTYNIAARWVDLDTSIGNGAAAHVVVNGVEVFGQISPYTPGSEPTYTGLGWSNGFGAAMPPQSYPLAAGDIVDFLVGPNGDTAGDLTAFNAVICRAPGVTISAPAAITSGDPLNVAVTLASGTELLGAALRVDGEPVLTDLTAPFAFVLPSLTPGEHHLQVEAISSERILGASNVVLVMVDAAAPSEEESQVEGESEVGVFTATGNIYDAITSGFWDEGDIWRKRDDNSTGVAPGPDDIAFLSRSVQVSLRGNVTVSKLYCEGRIRGDLPANNRELTVREHFSVHGLVADLTVINPVDGLLTNVRGAAFFENINMLNAGKMYLTNSLFATESELTSEGSLTLLNAPASGGPIRFTIDAALLNGVYAVGPGAGIQVDRLTSEGNGNLLSLMGPGLVGNDGASLIGNDGGTLVGNDGASLIGNDGSTLVGNDGGTLVGNDGASLIGNDSAGLIGNDSAGLISDNGAILVGNDGASLASVSAAALISNGVAGSAPFEGGDFGQAPGDSGISFTAGSLGGSGSLVGSITNSGAVIEPGNSPGTLWISGDFVQGEGGTLSFEVGGTATDPLEYDQLFVGGEATLGGSLILEAINGYNPPSGETVQSLMFRSRIGTFSRISSNASITFGPNGMMTEVKGASPAMSITASASRVKEGKSATFIISAPAGTARPLNVSFAVSGKAKSGRDYTLTTAARSLVIPVGRDSVSITMKTKKDKLSEKTETATMSLRPGSNYNISAQSSATVGILNVKPK